VRADTSVVDVDADSAVETLPRFVMVRDIPKPTPRWRVGGDIERVSSRTRAQEAYVR